ncbi:MAG: glycosyltransferase family 39 protein [Byssovorax sp.]
MAPSVDPASERVPERDDASAATREPGGDLPFTGLAFVAALLPRLYVAIAWAREPVWDGHYYDFGARRIAGGFGYSDDAVIEGIKVWHPWCHYPVGYSGFLGILYKIFGAGPHVATVANAVVGALLVAVVHRLSRYATGTWRARVASMITAASPGLIVYSALLMTEPLAAFGTLLAAWLFVRRKEAPAPGPLGWIQRPIPAVVAAGAALGLTILVRPQSLLCAPGLVFLALRPGPRGAWWPGLKAIGKALIPAGIALAAALTVVAPWSVRNCTVMDGCALVSTNAGWNLAIGAFPRATGRFETLHGTDGCPVVTGQVQQDRCWMEEGMRWIKASPRWWLGLIPKKLSYTFDHESFPMGYLGEADPESWPEPRKAIGRDVLSVSHRLLLAFAALGVIALPSHRRARDRLVQLGLLVLMLLLALHGVTDDLHQAWPLAVMIPVVAFLPLPGRPRNGGVIGYLAVAVASVVVTHAVFFGEDRYHMVLTPALAILAACALRRPVVEGAKADDSA